MSEQDEALSPLKRFEDFLSRLLSVPKTELDEALAAENEEPIAEDQATD